MIIHLIPLYMTVALQHNKMFKNNNNQEANLLVKNFYYLHVKHVLSTWSCLVLIYRYY